MTAGRHRRSRSARRGPADVLDTRSHPAQSREVSLKASAPHERTDFADRDLLDSVLAGLRRLDIEGEGARRVQRLEMLTEHLSEVLGWLIALPASRETDRVIALTEGWLESRPRDVAQPSDGYLSTLANVVHTAMRHLNRSAVAVAYAVVPASVSPVPVFTALENAVSRSSAYVAGYHCDVPGLHADERCGFREVEALIEARRIHMLVSPSMTHLVPERPFEAVGHRSREGIELWLSALGVRLILTDGSEVAERRPAYRAV
ncbi:hypothetical protein ACFCYH_01120 [Streptomyces sp. NPDC056400]|uniref:hypothetical protein n=1 Tax=Streptomyces sp. NPDC056400 TaxID=3345808 RepID=UPI0035D65D14